MKAKKLKTEIKLRGVKITWIAEKVGVSQPALSNYLSERRKMPLDIELKIKKLLKIR